jgi:uncharacterized protein
MSPGLMIDVTGMRPRAVVALVVIVVLMFTLSARTFADEVELEADEGTGAEEPAAVEGVRVPAAPESLLPFRIDEPEEIAAAPDETVEPVPDDVQPFRILGDEVPPGGILRLSWYADVVSDGLPEETPVLVAHGKAPGPVLCLTAAVHGDELNGIEIVRELLYDLDANRLAGTIVGVPIVNLHGFRQGERYLPDRRDLNRFFPGNPRGSFASRFAYSFFNSIVVHCDYLVDLHTGSFQRANLPQLRADLSDAGVQHLTRGFGATVVLHGEGPSGTLRRAATDAGIPAVVVETGEPHRFEPDQVAHGVRALRSLLNHLGMTSHFSLWSEPQPTYYSSRWVRAEGHGILSSQVRLGQTVREGTVLGTITDPITSARRTIRSPYAGRVLGMAVNQNVRPGYAVYHIGIRKSEGQLIEEAPKDESRHDVRAEDDHHDSDHAE